MDKRSAIHQPLSFFGGRRYAFPPYGYQTNLLTRCTSTSMHSDCPVQQLQVFLWQGASMQ